MSSRTVRRRARATRLQRRYRHGHLTFRLITDRLPEPATSPAFVLVHGIGMSHRSLARLHDALDKERAVFSIDLPGHGGLPKPRVDGKLDVEVDVREMARGLAGAIASLKIGPVILVGHSMGAQWITAIARQNPELVDRVVFIGPVVDPARRTLGHQACALARDSLGESPRINTIVTTDYLRCGTPWYAAQARHMFEYLIEDEVARLTVPVLIIRGQRDPIAKHEWCRALGDQAATSTLVTVPGHHHVVQHSASEHVAKAILAFSRTRTRLSGAAT